MKALAGKIGPRSPKEAIAMFITMLVFAWLIGSWTIAIGILLVAGTFLLIVWMAKHDPRTGDL